MTELVEKQFVVKTIKPVELILEMMDSNIIEVMEKQQEMLAVKIIKLVKLALEMLESNMTEPME